MIGLPRGRGALLDGAELSGGRPRPRRLGLPARHVRLHLAVAQAGILAHGQEGPRPRSRPEGSCCAQQGVRPKRERISQ